MKPEIRIGLIDSHLAVSEALRILLNGEERFTVSAIAQDYESGKLLIRNKNSDIVVLGMNLGKQETLELIALANSFHISTIIFSAFIHIQLIRKAMKAGALAFISKSSPSDHIIRAIIEVTTGGMYYDPIVQERINSLLDPNPKPITGFKTIVSHLTPREKEVLR